MFTTIITTIKTILEGIPAIKEVYPYPISGSPKKFPAVVFVPRDDENSQLTTSENFKLYRFSMWVLVDVAGTTTEKVFTEILPNAVDKIVAEFDSKWSSQIDNHRAWLIVSSGRWGLTEEEKSRQGWAELVLTFKVSKDI
jgi:hypothetical protein